MPDVSDITSTAVQLARRKGKSPAAPLKNLKSPGKMAAAGATMMALPFAAEGIAKLVGGSPKEKAADLGGLFGKGNGGSGEGGEGGEDATEAHGSGRRMPIQQSVDVAVPIKEAYDQWTRFEEWPEFMHRVDSVQQVDDSTVHISTKVWGVTKEFEAEIVEQRPDERIEWHSEDGLMNSGVVTFHRLAPRLTRIEVTMDVKPDSLLEKAGRGMRFTKRAVRGDLHRFKAYVEMEERTDKGWRGTIEDGDVKRKTERKSRSGKKAKARS